jgi:hypothetical protein
MNNFFAGAGKYDAKAGFAVADQHEYKHIAYRFSVISLPHSEVNPVTVT